MLPCAELKADEKHPDEGQPAEDNTPLSKDEDIEEITADDYFIKNAEASSTYYSPMHRVGDVLPL